MKYLFAAASAAAMLVAAPAFAGESPKVSAYGTVGYDALNTGGENFGGVAGRLGVRGQHLGIEGEAAFGVGSTDIEGVSVKMKNQYGVYAVAFLPAGDNFEFLARAGYGRVEIEADAGGASASGDDTSWRAGVGGQWFSGDNGVRFDVTHAWYNAGGDSDTVSLHYVRKFGG
jgi:hypothetical protein